MACVYYYKGHKFDSEIELDNFLITKEKFYSKFGDIVFDADQRQLTEIQKLEQLKIQNQKLFDEYRNLSNGFEVYYDELGDRYIKDKLDNKYEGVNKFLSKHKQAGSNDYYFPYFDLSEYFDGQDSRRRHWVAGEFNDVEIDEFFEGDPDKIQPLPSDKVTLDTYQKKIERRWDFQGRAGDSIHEICQIFFSKNNNGEDVRKMNDADMFNYIKSELAKGKNLQYLEKNGNPDGNIKAGINIAKKIYSNIYTSLQNDDHLEFYPELVVKGAGLDNNGQTSNLFGKIDLLVVDKTGKLHIYDYKTSIKSFGDFSDAKKNGYTYQLVTYYQMLENAGIAVQNASLNIIPIKLENFKKDSNGNYQFDGVSDGSIERINEKPITEKAHNQIEAIMPSKFDIHITGDDVVTEVQNIEKWCPNSNISRQVTLESTKWYLEKNKAFEKKNNNNKYEFTLRDVTGKIKIVEKNTKDELVQAIFEERKKLTSSKNRAFQRMQEALKKGIEEEDPNQGFPTNFKASKGSATFVQDTLSKYCNKEWEIIEIPEFNYLGIIVLRNKNTKQFDFVGVSTNNLHENIYKSSKDDKIKGRTTLLGYFETDAQAEQKYKRLVLEGIKGNVELMQIMLAINGSKGFDSAAIGNIQVINPYDVVMVTASNEQLLMNFNALQKYSPTSTNKFDSGDIKLLSYLDLLKKELDNIWAIGERDGWKNKEFKSYQKYLESCKSDLDAAMEQGDKDKKIKAVNDLIYKMRTEIDTNSELDQDFEDQQKLQSQKIRLYNLMLSSLLELKNINLRQQISDGHLWFSSLSKALKEGVSGNMIDNPGNLKSETLNLITRLVKEANQNTRDVVQKKKVKLDKIIEQLKKDIGFNYLKENVGFNQAKLYQPLYRTVTYPNGTKDIWFNKIEDVPVAYRPLLNFMLLEINSKRFPLKSEQQLQAIINDTNNYDERFYRIPLAKGSLDSKISNEENFNENGTLRILFKGLVAKLKYLNPQNWKELYDKTQEYSEQIGIREKRAENRANKNIVFELENYFDRGESDREQMLNSHKLEEFETNAETLVLKHIFAYAQKNSIDEVFPLIQAAKVHLNIQGANANESFKADNKYFKDYVKNKLQKESIIDPQLQGVSKILSNMKRAASMMTLSFTPVQMIYQPIQGLWNDISLMIRNPDGKDSFTFQNFRFAIKIVGQDLFNFSGKPTLCSLLNELYALNDMDMHKYIDNITKNKKGFLYNFEGMCYKFASRPDYYNRMSIFLSQMLSDGCFEAHSVENGELMYDWKKDKRFSKFAQNPNDLNNRDPEYIKQRSLYFAMAQQFVNEHATYSDGTEFVLDPINIKPLPRAYTSQQAESHKNIADSIYGYYTEENKSLVQATALGSMWLQFKTYWSSKKDQYLQAGGVYQRGSWENYTEIEKDSNGNQVLDNNGNPKIIEYYYDINPDGSINFEKIVKKDELSPDKQLAPVTYWKGQWQEGILVTLSKLCNKGKFISNYHQLMQEDPDMARCYKDNFQKLAIDLAFFLLGGCLLGGLLSDMLKDLLKENKDNTDFITGCKLAAANVAVRSVTNSFMDFNWFESMGNPLMQWTPFAVSFTTNTVKNLSKFATGDQDIVDATVNMFGGSKQIKPIFDALKPEQFRTRQEGGTWESATTIRNREQ